MNQLKFFYYDFNFKLKSNMDFNALKDIIQNKLLHPTFHKELRANGENVFAYLVKVSYDNITIRYIDVNTDISNKSIKITNEIKEYLSKDKELQQNVEFISMYIEENQCPPNFPDSLSGYKEGSYILLISSNGIKFLYINNRLKASGDEALKISYSIYKRTNSIPRLATLNYETSNNFDNMPMNLFDIKKEDIEFVD